MPSLHNQRFVTEDTTLETWNLTVHVDASAGPVTITLPPASGFDDQTVRIIKEDDSGNLVLVSANGDDRYQGINDIGGQTGVLTIEAHGSAGVTCISAVPQVLQGSFTSGNNTDAVTLLPPGTIKNPGRTKVSTWINRSADAWFDAGGSGGSTPSQGYIRNDRSVAFYTNANNMFNQPGFYRVEIW